MAMKPELLIPSFSVETPEGRALPEWKRRKDSELYSFPCHIVTTNTRRPCSSCKNVSPYTQKTTYKGTRLTHTVIVECTKSVRSGKGWQQVSLPGYLVATKGSGRTITLEWDGCTNKDCFVHADVRVVIIDAFSRRRKAVLKFFNRILGGFKMSKRRPKLTKSKGVKR